MSRERPESLLALCQATDSGLSSPRKRLGEFTSLATADSVKAKVRKRVDQFGDDKIEWYNGIFLPHLESMSVGSMAWEDLLSAMESEGAGTEFRQFYQECCAHANL